MIQIPKKIPYLFISLFFCITKLAYSAFDFDQYIEKHQCPAVLDPKSIEAAKKYPLLVNEQLFSQLSEFPWANNPDLESQLIQLMSSAIALHQEIISTTSGSHPYIETLPLGYFTVTKYIEKQDDMSPLRLIIPEHGKNEATASFVDRELSFNMTPLTILARDARRKPTKSRQILIPNTVTIDAFLEQFPVNNNETIIPENIKDELINQFYKLIAYDFVIGQRDRMMSNYRIAMLKKLPRIIAIDNALSMPINDINIINHPIALRHGDLFGVLSKKLKLDPNNWKFFFDTSEGDVIKQKMNNFIQPKNESQREARKHMERRQLIALNDRISQILEMLKK